MTKKFVVIVNNKGMQKPAFRVHKEGCKDIAMECRRLHTHSFTIEGDTPEDAIKKQAKNFQEQDMGYTEKSFGIAPCLKRRTKTPVVFKASDILHETETIIGGQKLPKPLGMTEFTKVAFAETPEEMAERDRILKEHGFVKAPKYQQLVKTEVLAIRRERGSTRKEAIDKAIAGWVHDYAGDLRTFLQDTMVAGS